MSGLKPEDVVNRLRQTIINGVLGKDYTIISRYKNNLLREKYLIDDAKIKIILLDLTVDDYVYSDESNNKNFEDDVVQVFGKDVLLIRRFSETILPEQVKLYIKFT